MSSPGLATFTVFILATAMPAAAEIYACKLPDGTQIYTNHKQGECRKLENLPELIPAPRRPSDEGRPERKKSESPEKLILPAPGGLIQSEPPRDDAILIHDVKAIPNYNNALGTAKYQADMRVTNADAEWTAAQVCVKVRFRDTAKTSIDVHQTSCFDDLKPFDDRPFTVVHTGRLPSKPSAVVAEVQVSSVKWIK
jgi:hypothetical protein